jgi:hypothetical protein
MQGRGDIRVMTMRSAVILAAVAGVVLAGGMEASASGHGTAPSRLAQTPLPNIAKSVRVRVTAACEEGAALFQVFNEGEAWPQPGKIAIYRTEGRVLVSQRSMRMASGQRASFKVKSPGGNIELGLSVEPTWYTRPAAYDAKIACK